MVSIHSPNPPPLEDPDYYKNILLNQVPGYV